MDVARFTKILGMLGSSHDGERAAAALKATELLRSAGKSWSDVGLGGAARVQRPGAAELAQWMSEAAMWRTLCEDERRASRRLQGELDKAKNEIKRLKGLWPSGGTPPEPAKKGKRKRQVPPEAAAERPPPWEEPKQQEADLGDYDATLRERIAMALDAHKAGELPLTDRTLEFLTSVAGQLRWSDRQREAVEKTLRWVFKR